MRRITITFFVLAGIAALGAGGISTALSASPGPGAVGLFLGSAAISLVALAGAARILYVLDHAGTVRERVNSDR
ncbi:MAG: hypothetical protein HYX32_09585 [Actinobacteria bacterium]|nr:hypothetical protein [Actinomycetota bacterium]